MIDLRQRSLQKELLDNDNIPFSDLKKCLQELNTVNILLGGHSISLEGVSSFYSNEKHFGICEIGCGGGNNLQAISKKLNAPANQFYFTGIDIKKECIDFAAQQYPGLRSKWLASDYKKVKFEDCKPHVIFSSLFCHHFTNEELAEMLKWMYANSEKGFFINDLQRSPIAYYLIKWLSALFSKSYLLKNDACISVARSFRKKDWLDIFEKAGISNYSIRWKWAFRYLIICKK